MRVCVLGVCGMLRPLSSDSESDGDSDFQDGQSDAGTESEASPDLRDGKEHSHSEKSSGTVVSCYG